MSISKNVLIADEDPLLGVSICAELAGLGFSCSFCRFYNHIEKYVEGHDPELIIINVNQHEDSCIDALKRLSELNCQSSVFIISDADAPVANTVVQSASMLELRIAGILKKPFSLPTLSNKVTELHRSAPDTKTSIPPPLNAITPQWPAEKVLKKALQTAIGNNEIHVVYQPQIDLGSHTLTGVEALARWKSETYGQVPPTVFIPLAEKCSLIAPLTNAITRISLGWLHEFGDTCSRLPPGAVSKSFRLSLNVSPASLHDNSFADRLDELLVSFRLSRQSIVLEVTETSSIAESNEAYEVLTRLRLRGYHLAIDDIGTGYASLQQLTRLPFSEVKIDRCFITSALTSYESAVITRSITKMAHALNLTVTAEGVENEETLKFIKESGCNTGQGYHFARPMKSCDLNQWLTEQADKAAQSRLATLKTLAVAPGVKNTDMLDRMVRLSSRILNLPICLVSILDQAHCHVISAEGVDKGALPIDNVVCSKLLPDRSMLYVSDLAAEEPEQASIMTGDKEPVRFYVSHALRAANGCIVGSFVVADSRAGNLTPGIIRGLPTMSSLLEKELFYPKLTASSAFHLHKMEKRFLQRADVLIALAESMTLSFQLVQIKTLSSSANAPKAIRLLRNLCQQHLESADLIMQTSLDEINVVFVGREKSWVLELLVQFERNLKALETIKPTINCLKVSHYYPPANFGDTLQHLFCCRQESRESLIFIRADKQR